MDGSNATSQISLAIAPNQTFATLVARYEGVRNIPIPTSFGFALNLSTVATDTFIRANDNPIAGKSSTMFTGSGVSGCRLSSDAALARRRETLAVRLLLERCDLGPNDQWGSITLVGSFIRPGYLTGDSVKSDYRLWCANSLLTGSSRQAVELPPRRFPYRQVLFRHVHGDSIQGSVITGRTREK